MINLFGLHSALPAMSPGFGTPPWVGALVFSVLGLFVLSVAAICFVEAWLLLNGYAPITSFVRSDIDHHRVLSIAILAVVFTLAGHFWR